MSKKSPKNSKAKNASKKKTAGKSKNNKNRTSSKSGKLSKLRNFNTILLIAAVTFLISTVLFYFIAKEIWKDDTPVKDKKLPLEVQQFSGVINQIINNKLDDIGITPSDYAHQELMPVEVNGVNWSQVVKEINLPQDLNLQDVASAFLDRMQGMENQVQFSMGYPDPYTLQLEWQIGKYPTHRLVFYQQKDEINLKSGDSKVKAFVAIIIDDIGFKRSLAMEFLDLPADLTFSILPQSTFG